MELWYSISAQMIQRWTEKDLKDLGLTEQNGVWRKVSVPKSKKKAATAKKSIQKLHYTAQEYQSFIAQLPNQDWSGLEKEYIEACFKELKIDYVKEYEFAKPERKFRFDYSCPLRKFYVEYDGLMSKKSRHTTVSGFSKDQEKLNLASSMGWHGCRYSVLNYKQCFADLKREFSL